MKTFESFEPFVFQIVSLNPEPAPGDAELRPLAAAPGQEPVLPWPIQTLLAHGAVYCCLIILEPT